MQNSPPNIKAHRKRTERRREAKNGKRNERTGVNRKGEEAVDSITLQDAIRQGKMMGFFLMEGK